jgi:high-affinity iron transporter
MKTKQRSRRTNWSFYLWVGLALGIACLAVILGWHSGNGTADPSNPANAVHMTRTTAVINSAVLVFREGLETILVLAAITASFRGSNSGYRKPIAIGGGLAILAAIGTWFIAVGVLSIFSTTGLTLQAATGIPAIIVLLLVMNWFFHKVYWTGWISHHNKRRKSLLSSDGNPNTNRRRMLFGFALLGFSSVYREGFEIVLFLQNLRLTFGSSVVLEGVVLGALFTTATGFLTFKLHAKLPYKKLLIITGVMLLVVLVVMVGEEINEMQLAGWLPTTSMGFNAPGWLGQWFSIFSNWQTVIAQIVAVAIVVGSYVGAQYFRVWRPRRRGEQAARMAEAPPVSTITSTPVSI